MPTRVIQLLPATAIDARLAYEEVKDFATTDMGRGGPQQWTYRVLHEPLLTEELARLSHAKSQTCADSVTFQPCPSFDVRSQDRPIVEEWSLFSETWNFTAVLDGHMNHETVDYVAKHLPYMVRNDLHTRLHATATVSPSSVSEVLSQAIIKVDDSIKAEFLGLFPHGETALRNANSEAIGRFVNDGLTGGNRYSRVARVLGGSTVLLTLLRKGTGDLWVANLGDCCAVLGSKERGQWIGTFVNSVHNGDHCEAELQRVRNEHPGEPFCVAENRVLGWLAPTRAIGDTWLNLPSFYTEKVLLHLDAPWLRPESIKRYIPRIITPPYVSKEPDVYHHRLRLDYTEGIVDAFLITCSDGLLDLHNDGRSLEEIANHWVRVAGHAMDQRAVRRNRVNLALALLHDSLGGTDEREISRNLTVEMEERWMDDTTIVVQRFIA